MLKKTIEIIRPSIFQIQVQTFEQKFQYKKLPVTIPIGTAFAVSDSGLLVTALHVVEGAEKIISASGGNIMAGFAGPKVDTPEIKIHASFVGTGVEVVGSDSDNDLALLKLPINKLNDLTIKVGPDELEATPIACTIDTEIPNDGEPIGISGYPLSEPSLVTTSGNIASNWTLNNHQDSYLGDITANPGNSGGPVYKLSNGKILGVCVAGKLTNVIDNSGNNTQMLHSAGLTLITPSRAIDKLIENYNNKENTE